MERQPENFQDLYAAWNNKKTLRFYNLAHTEFTEHKKSQLFRPSIYNSCFAIFNLGRWRIVEPSPTRCIECPSAKRGYVTSARLNNDVEDDGWHIYRQTDHE